MALIPQGYLDSVVSIGVRTDTNIAWIGTGFFIGKSTGTAGQVYPFLVSNKHVFANRRFVVIRMRQKGVENLNEINVPLTNDGGLPLYYVHEKESVDIAVLPLEAKFIKDNNLEFPCFNIEENSMSSDELRQNGVDEGSIIYMLGFPMGLVNVTSNLPICRMGCVARMSENQIIESHNILVDIQNFPGNSGSPIVTKPERVSIVETKSLSRCVLVGIVHSYIPYQEKLINSQTNQVVEIRSENSGIALVHPVEYIREILNKFL